MCPNVHPIVEESEECDSYQNGQNERKVNNRWLG